MALFAFALRAIGLRTAYELHIDETTYSEISRTVAAGGGVTLFGEPFFLHPPAFFLIAGGFLHLIGDYAHQFDVSQILDLRWITAALGTGTCVVLVVFLRRVAGTWAAVVAGVIYALDPFIIRFDSRVFLEAMTLFWIVCGLLVFCRAPAPSLRRGLAAGVLFGLAVLTKDTATIVTILPLAVVAFVLPEWRRPALAAIGVVIAMYLAYLLVLLGIGEIGEWLDAKDSGVLRLIGVKQETGFNKPGSVSFFTALKRNAPLYGISYLYIGVGTLAALDQLRLRKYLPSIDLVLAIVQLSSVAQLVYGFFFGTLEEQMFYFLAVLSIPTTAIVFARLCSDRGRLRLALGGLAALWIALAATSWTILHTSHDDAYLQLSRYIEDGNFHDRRVAVAEDVAQFVLHGVQIEPFLGVDKLKRERAEYVLLSTKLVRDGFGEATRRDLRWLRSHARLSYQVKGRTVGALQLYQLPRGRRR